MDLNRTRICASVIAVCTAGGAAAQETTDLTIIHASPPGHPITRAVETWMECMETTEGPMLNVSYFPGGQIASLPELLQAINNEVGQAAPIPVGYVSEKLPLNGVVMLPGLGQTARDVIEAYSAALESGPLRDEFSQNDLVPIWNMAFPPYQIMSTGAPMTSLEDFKGKVIRSAGGTMNLTIEALGAAPADITMGDIYVALERGTVDATISSLSSLRSYKLDELAKAVSTNANFGTFTNVFSIDAEKWNAMSPQLQEKALACGARAEDAVATFLDEETAQLASEFGEQGIEVYEFSGEALAAINEAMTSVSDDWVSRLEGRGLPAQQVLDDFTARFGDGS